jgi:hypothetical protein
MRVALFFKIYRWCLSSGVFFERYSLLIGRQKNRNRFYKVFGAEKSKGKASIHDFQMVMSIFQKTEVADTI